MLFFTRWKAAGILLTALVVCLFAVPNFFSESTVRTWPSWAQRHIVLGLDLQGGSSLLLEVDTNAVRKERLQGACRRRAARAAPGPHSLHRTRHSRQQRRGAHHARQRRRNALSKLRELSQPLSGILGSSGQRSVDITENGGLITLTPSDAAITERIRQAVDQSIQIIERRVNELGLVEPTIQREGADRILVQVPGLQDPSRLKEILGKTAKLDFRMVDLSMTPEQAMATHPPPDSEILDGERRPEISHREARARLRRRSGRRPAGLRPAQQRADRQLPLQFDRCAQVRRGDAAECRQAVRHRARQQGDLGAGHPRAHPRRLRADFRQFHRAVGQRSRHPAARRRAAGAAHRRRGAHGRTRPRPGLRSMPASTPPMWGPRSSSSSCW